MGCNWIDLKDELPKANVLVIVKTDDTAQMYHLCVYKEARTISVPLTTIENDPYKHNKKFYDYDEDADTWYVPEGFYVYSGENQYWLNHNVEMWMGVPDPETENTDCNTEEHL